MPSASKYNLESRLCEYAKRIIRLSAHLDDSLPARHVARQLLRSGTSPFANHGEAEGAESREDFVHKLRLCLKELRETIRWLALIRDVPLLQKPELVIRLIDETDQLIRIFHASITTARRVPNQNLYSKASPPP